MPELSEIGPDSTGAQVRFNVEHGGTSATVRTDAEKGKKTAPRVGAAQPDFVVGTWKLETSDGLEATGARGRGGAEVEGKA